MDALRLLTEAMKQSTAAKAVGHIINRLLACEDVALLSLLLEDPAEDKMAVIDGLKKTLIGNQKQFDNKMINVFKQLVDVTTHNELIAIMKQRPVVASALNYVVDLYAQYAKSPDVLNRLAIAGANVNELWGVGFPEVQKSDRVPDKFAEQLANSVKREIIAKASDYIQSPQTQAFYRDYNKWPAEIHTENDEVTDADIAAAGGPLQAQNVRQAPESAQPAIVGFNESIKFVKAINDILTKSGQHQMQAVYNSKNYQQANDNLSKHYLPLVVASFKQYRVNPPKPVNVTVYYNGPHAMKESEFIKLYSTNRTEKDPDWWASRIAVNIVGPYYPMTDLQPFVVKGLDQMKAVHYFVQSLVVADARFQQDLANTKADTMRI